MLERLSPVVKNSAVRLALGDLKGKLELLNRGQRWVIRKIEEQLPALADARLKAFLTVMAQGHRVNIAAVDEALNAGQS